ncbi:MAG: D-isomer specific 2-hydroxyacid dehydrogenase family protein [Actinomycetota bacterium]|nr:D-isomer specific 2-hydroxyacid dehydrogenase family protein [Actinomycetota bacterium]
MRPLDAELPVALAPGDGALLADAIRAGGGRRVSPAEAEALVWNDWQDVDGLRACLTDAPQIRWVQLPFAGVDNFLSVLDGERIWTSAKGAYSQPVAEHALALGLAGLRQLTVRARARSWGRPAGKRLFRGRVTILGGGGITEALVPLLAPFEVEVTVVRRHPTPMSGVARVVGQDELHDVLPGAALIVLALALTPQTAGIIDAAALERIDADAWLVNVARGAHVVTDDLVMALRTGAIGGAALDVTEPEPLPDGHPLWDLDNCLITPHVANTWEMAEPALAERVRQNVERYRRGEPLLGVVNPDLGY